MSTDDNTTSPRMSYYEAVNCIRRNLAAAVRREMEAAKVRVTAEMAGHIRSLPMVLGEGWEQTEGATAIAEDLVNAALGTDLNADSRDYAIDHEIAQHGLGIHRRVSDEALADLAKTLDGAVPGALQTVSIVRNRFVLLVPQITALEVSMGEVGAVEDRFKAAVQEWAVRFNTSPPDLSLRLEEDVDDNLRVEVTL